MIDLIRWVIGGLCCAAGAWISILNWGVFWRGVVRRERAPSWIPLLGGMLGAFGLLTLPIAKNGLAVVSPLLLDWGSIPGIGYTILWYLFRVLVYLIRGKAG